MVHFYEGGYVIGALLAFVTAIVVLIGDARKPTNRLLSALSALIAVWFIGRLMILKSNSAADADQWQKLTYTGSLFITPVYTHFVYAFLRRKFSGLLLGYVLCSILVILNFSTDIFVTEMRAVPVLNYYETAGPLFYIYLAIYLLFPAGGFFLLKRELRNPDSSPSRKNQIQYIILASNIGFACGLTTFPLCFGINVPPVGAPFSSVYVLIISYAILVHRLLDFNLIIRWGAAFVATLVAVGVIYLAGVYALETLLARKFSISSGLITVFLTSSAVLVFDAIRLRVTRLVDHLIFKSPDFQQLISGIEKELLIGASIQKTTQGLANEFKRILNVTHVGFAVLSVSDAHFVLFPSESFEKTPITRIKEQITRSDFLVRTLETERRLFKYGIVVEEEVTNLGNRAFPGERTTFWKIRRTMRWLGAQVAVPLMNGSEIIGFIVLGPKQVASLFNDEDKKFLAHVAELISNGYLTAFVTGDSVPPADAMAKAS